MPAGNRLQAFPIPILNEIYPPFPDNAFNQLGCVRQLLTLLYVLIATLILPPHNKAVVVIDMDHQFNSLGPLDASRLRNGELHGRREALRSLTDQ